MIFAQKSFKTQAFDLLNPNCARALVLLDPMVRSLCLVPARCCFRPHQPPHLQALLEKHKHQLPTDRLEIEAYAKSLSRRRWEQHQPKSRINAQQ
mmetsp:Transcript_24610/g.52490  ORF Transcript_24610/g.52490 Transcript_24610/m.52490 type:complete len:95 (+) Transcript_24610:1140-1424(+)